ncbi:uncharacterized protein LOC142162002 [Nicotiana tabacum]|uniref:Uncharacterized protein LOC142162002 n=1 Tax=Nicotiana tabacum TaxID=4097 RepID=A0AC58RNV1_TOBAC
MEIHDQLIHGIIQHGHTNIIIHFLAVYELYNIPARRELWRKLKEIEELMIHPWLIMGDFNSIIYVKDRSQGNEWMNAMPPLQVHIKDPCLLCFRFLNCLANHPKFADIVKSGWSSQRLNSEEFIGVWNKIQNIRDKLNKLQAQMRDISHSTGKYEGDKELKKQLEKWSIIEESIYRQKSRVKWLKLGDSNTAYFYANMKGEEHKII